MAQALKVFVLARPAAGRVAVKLVWLLAVLMLLSAGITYRVLASRLKLVVDTPITLPVPLSDFPTRIGNWTGTDTPLSETIRRVAGNDDYLNRLYINKSNGQWVNVYIAYTARPRTMLGHRPDICYVGGGWVHDSTEQAKFISSFGRHVPCLIHRFHMPAPRNDAMVVLNYYILNGHITNDDRGFSGIAIRTPNIEGDLARYVAQIQISSILENSVRDAAKDMAELVLDFFPDENGQVRVAELPDTTSGALK